MTTASYRTSYVTSQLKTQSSSYFLMLQSIIAQSKFQIAHSLTSFQQKTKTKMEEDFLFRGALQCNNGLVSKPKQQKTEENKFLAKAYFLKHSQTISLIPV